LTLIPVPKRFIEACRQAIAEATCDRGYAPMFSENAINFFCALAPEASGAQR
jgi:hypothetical protein